MVRLGWNQLVHILSSPSESFRFNGELIPLPDVLIWVQAVVPRYPAVVPLVVLSRSTAAVSGPYRIESKGSHLVSG